MKPDTLIRWHRQGWRLFWRWKSRPGRPPIPVDLQRLIVAMARANPTWGEERLANELRLKLGLTVRRAPWDGISGPCDRPAAVARPNAGRHLCGIMRRRSSPVISSSRSPHVFRAVYVFVVLDVATRRIVHWNVTEHPTADWTIQQFRTVLTPETAHRFVHRDGIYAAGVDRAIASMGRRVLKIPPRTPPANAFCERVIGTMRRECLDWLIPLNERHLRGILRAWVTHYNRGRPHASLGPGIPEASPERNPPVATGHHLPPRCRVVAAPILNGLHHEYRMVREAA